MRENNGKIIYTEDDTQRKEFESIVYLKFKKELTTEMNMVE
jgi:hypothetical protein